jgi:hypothetical protein
MNVIIDMLGKTFLFDLMEVFTLRCVCRAWRDGISHGGGWQHFWIAWFPLLFHSPPAQLEKAIIFQKKLFGSDPDAKRFLISTAMATEKDHLSILLSHSSLKNVCWIHQPSFVSLFSERSCILRLDGSLRGVGPEDHVSLPSPKWDTETCRDVRKKVYFLRPGEALDPKICKNAFGADDLLLYPRQVLHHHENLVAQFFSVSTARRTSKTTIFVYRTRERGEQLRRVHKRVTGNDMNLLKKSKKGIYQLSDLPFVVYKLHSFQLSPENFVRLLHVPSKQLGFSIFNLYLSELHTREIKKWKAMQKQLEKELFHLHQGLLNTLKFRRYLKSIRVNPWTMMDSTNVILCSDGDGIQNSDDGDSDSDTNDTNDGGAKQKTFIERMPSSQPVQSNYEFFSSRSFPSSSLHTMDSVESMKCTEFVAEKTTGENLHNSEKQNADTNADIPNGYNVQHDNNHGGNDDCISENQCAKCDVKKRSYESIQQTIRRAKVAKFDPSRFHNEDLL